MGRFVKTNKAFTVTGVAPSNTAEHKINPWKVEMEPSTANQASHIDKWFDAPVLPGVSPSDAI